MVSSSLTDLKTDQVHAHEGAPEPRGNRLPNRLTDKQARFDYNKRKTTWKTVDFFVDMVARGTVEELTEFVANAEKFAEARRHTKIVVLDQTALWLKL